MVEKIEIIPIGGYGEIGKNMTAVRIDDDVIIFDMGIHLPNWIKLTENDDLVEKMDAKMLQHHGAIPNDKIIEDLIPNVRAIIPSHAHLDHVGAIPFLAKKYKCPIYAAPFTAEVIKNILADEEINIPNRIIKIKQNTIFKIGKLKMEFINTTHSTPHAVLPVIHTDKGAIIYTCDFKFDEHPVIGKKPNYRRLKQLGDQGVYAMIADSLYSPLEKKMPGEKVVREMLREVLLETDNKNKAIVVTTFSSHIARLKSIVDFSKKLNRRVVFLGRSLNKYVDAAQKVGIERFRGVELIKYGNKIKRKIKQIATQGTHKYVLVVTGHQGEPKASLSKMIDGVIPFKFKEGDHVIFCSSVIPTEINISQREILDEKLRKKGVILFKDIHQSGHAAREDIREMLKLTRPKHIIPGHSEQHMMESFETLGVELGYKPDKIHLIKNGQILKLD